MFVDLDAPDVKCANVGPGAEVFGGAPSLTIDPNDGALYYVDRDETLDSPTKVLRTIFDPLVRSTEDEWTVPDSAADGDEVVATFDASTCGGAMRPRLVYHGPTEQIGVVCDGIAPGLALLAFDGSILAQWSIESYAALQFAADGRVVFESTIGDIFVADAGAIDTPSRVDWQDLEEKPVVWTVRILGKDVLAAGVGSQGELRRYRRDGDSFALEAELGALDIGPLDAADAPDLSLLLEPDGDVIVHAWVLPEDEENYDVRARVQRFAPGGAQLLFDSLAADEESPPPDMTVLDVFIAG